MKKAGQYLPVIFAAVLFLLLIFDNHTAYAGATEGIRLCIDVIIPSLFPFFVIANYICNSLIGHNIPGITFIGKQLSLPAWCTSFIFVGFLGGYPVGAQLITDAYNSRNLGQRNARILLGYCNNCGPAFIFGVIGSLFSSVWIPITLWLTHMSAALITGYILPRPVVFPTTIQGKTNGSLTQALQKSIKSCGYVCGWVIIFRILLSYMFQFLEGRTSALFLTIISGLLELSNGCIQLKNVENETVRYIIASIFLNFGGISVMLQTASVTASVGLGLYAHGKMVQTCVSTLIAFLILPFIFTTARISIFIWAILLFTTISTICLMRNYCKNRCRNMGNIHV